MITQGNNTNGGSPQHSNQGHNNQGNNTPAAPSTASFPTQVLLPTVPASTAATPSIPQRPDECFFSRGVTEYRAMYISTSNAHARRNNSLLPLSQLNGVQGYWEEKKEDAKNRRADELLVVWKGQVVGQYLAPRLPAKTDIASCSKSLLSVTLLRFLDQKFDGDRVQIEKYLTQPIVNIPDVDPARWEAWRAHPLAQEITLHQLLTHTSGLPGNPRYQQAGKDEKGQFNYNHQNNWDFNKTIRELDFLQGLPINPPGTYEYSNPGSQAIAAILSDIIEYEYSIATNTNGKSRNLKEFVEREVFHALGMQSTEVVCYDKYNTQPLMHAFVKSTAWDLYQVAAMLLNDGKDSTGAPFLSKDARDLLLRSWVTGIHDENRNQMEYGYLWRVYQAKGPSGNSGATRYFEAVGSRGNSIQISEDGLITIRLHSHEYVSPTLFHAAIEWLVTKSRALLGMLGNMWSARKE